MRGRFLDLSILLHFWNLEFEWQSMGFTIKTFRSSDRTILGQSFSLSEKSVMDIGEWLWHLSEYCPNFWNSLQFFLIGVAIMKHFFSVTSQQVSHEWYGFLFWECRFRLRSLVGHSYVSFNVTQKNLFETFVILFQRHLLASQPKFVECV